MPNALSGYPRIEVKRDQPPAGWRARIDPLGVGRRLHPDPAREPRTRPGYGSSDGHAGPPGRWMPGSFGSAPAGP